MTIYEGMTIGDLRKAVAEAKVERIKAMNRERELDHQLALSLATAQGVRIGTTMTLTTTQGYGQKKKIVTKRARVIRISPSWNGNFKLHGTTIRKDGSDGEVRELYSFDPWKVEAQDAHTK